MWGDPRGHVGHAGGDCRGTDAFCRIFKIIYCGKRRNWARLSKSESPFKFQSVTLKSKQSSE